MGTGLAGLMGEGREGQEFGNNWQRYEGEKKTLAITKNVKSLYGYICPTL
jgi:hypothetical protein